MTKVHSVPDRRGEGWRRLLKDGVSLLWPRAGVMREYCALLSFFDKEGGVIEVDQSMVQSWAASVFWVETWIFDKKTLSNQFSN
ncbi:MAG: hypothetical protein NPIRA01_16580 [Nitrospirales bacterium]|nr:MAG: hypothetical protein NPIRA01_16580 [Nitrospirales bacterium]